MSPSGPNYPTTAATASGSNTAWTSPTNVEVSDGVYASATLSSAGSTNNLTTGGYGFNLPPTAVIDGIYVEFQRYASNTIETSSVQIMKAGSLAGAAKTGADGWPTSFEAWTGYGGASDLWGTTWLYSDINNSGFGFALSAKNISGGGTAYVDAMRITVYWHTAPIAVFKDYIYKVFSSTGQYLGNLPNVTSEFAISLDINTTGTTLQVECATSADTSYLPVSTLTDESGNILTDESSNTLTTEGTPPIVSLGTGPQALIQNGNHVEVYEYGYWHPNGVCLFQGQIQRWEAGHGGSSGASSGAAISDATADSITVLLYSDGADMGDYMVLTAPVLDQSQTSSGSFFYLTPTGTNSLLGQGVAPGAGVTNINQIVLNIAAFSIELDYYPVVTVSLYASGSGISNLARFAAQDTPDATSSQPITSTSYQNYTFNFHYTFPNGTPSEYIIGVTVSQSDGVNVSYDGSNVYGGGSILSNSISTGDLYFETYYASTSTAPTFSGYDPGTILQDALSSSYSGMINWSTSTIAETGLSLNYEFNTNTVLEVLQAMQSIAPNGFYYTVDLGSDTLYFQQSDSTADFTLVKGNVIGQIVFIASIESIINTAFFTGGTGATGAPTAGTTSVYAAYSDPASVNLYGPKLDRPSDSNVTDDPTALTVAQADVEANSAEQYQTTVTVLDSKTIDITLLKVGKTVGFAGFGNFIDSMVLQIVHVDYAPSYVTLTLGTLPKRLNKVIAELTASLTGQETILNPTTPSFSV